jgi:hypothetical protein
MLVVNAVDSARTLYRFFNLFYQSRTGGLIIWRSGSSVVLYRGTTYKFQCVQSYTKQNEAGMDVLQYAEEATNSATSSAGMKDLARTLHC